MKIKRLVIENFKSIERIELIEPNPFTVFVGPNGSGKSNIFEALEFVNYSSKSLDASVEESFGGITNFLNRRLAVHKQYFSFKCEFETFISQYQRVYNTETANSLAGRQLPILTVLSNEGTPLGTVHGQEMPKNFFLNQLETLAKENPSINTDADTFYQRFSRIFIGNEKYEKLKRNSDVRLSLSALNLEKVLGRLLADIALRDELHDWLDLFIPSFDKVEIATNNLTGEDSLLFYDKLYERPFTKELISDGTYNILALLTAVYQSEKPQFLCIEEPENGLNPKVVKELVNLCRYACEEFGHFIWLNTHSQTLVSQLTPDEIILVDKEEGATHTKQIKGMNLHDLPMDEAWLSNALGGGLPW